jgi:hypothetical protein
MLKANTKSKAQVVDGKLILSCPTAISPVVWQMDLTQAKASAMEVQTQGDVFQLNLRTAKNENVLVASFLNKSAALKTLQDISRALNRAHGTIRPAEQGTARKGKGFLGWVGWGASVIVTAVILVFSMGMIVTAIYGPLPQTIEPLAGPDAQTPSIPAENGVPLSADDFLKGR